MNIKNIETKKVETDPFAPMIESGFVQMEEGYKFEPYFTACIATDCGTFKGRGETEEAALEAAKEMMLIKVNTKADEAIRKVTGELFIDC